MMISIEKLIRNRPRNFFHLIWCFCEFVTFPFVSWVRCGTWLYRFLIFATLLTFIWAVIRWNFGVFLMALFKVVPKWINYGSYRSVVLIRALSCDLPLISTKFSVHLKLVHWMACIQKRLKLQRWRNVSMLGNLISLLPSAEFSFKINCFQKYIFQEYE